MLHLNLKDSKGTQVSVGSYGVTAQESFGPAKTPKVLGSIPSHLSLPDRDLQAETLSSAVGWGEVTLQLQMIGFKSPSPQPPTRWQQT
jgi:hypothetical protein